MEAYKVKTHPLTGDLIWQLTYSQSDFALVEKFIDENYYADYTISFYDAITGATLELANKVSEIKDNIAELVCKLSCIEHTFVHFVGINSLSESYVISIDFSRGNFRLPCTCKWENGRII
ncbi:MAG: hypothetical protein HDR22_02985 [Lachnospiraceae bacterium]|nr:hypothetical protein [Lachnospiraceae bacterium]